MTDDDAAPPVPARSQRLRQYDDFAKRYQEIKLELMIKYPHVPDTECGNRALEKTDEAFGYK